MPGALPPCYLLVETKFQTIFLILFPHAISLWNMIPGSLLLCFKLRPTNAETPPEAPSLSQQNDTTLRSASEQLVYVCRWHEILPRSSIQRCMFNSFSVRSLLRQPRSALEAGPSEAHAISFVHTPRPHLHRKDCAFSLFCPCQRNNGPNTNWAEASSIFGAGGFGW